MRNSVITATHLVLIRDDREILLLRRFNTGFQDGNYSLPAGHVEPGELPLAASVREAQEEIGLALRPEDLRMSHIVHTPTRAHFFFTVLRWKGEPVNCEPDKCDHLDWFGLDSLPGNMVPYVRQALACLRKGQAYSERDD